MSEQELIISYTFKEVLERLEGKIDALSVQLDKELEHLEKRVDDLETFRTRFLPASVAVAIVVLVNGLSIWLAPHV